MPETSSARNGPVHSHSGALFAEAKHEAKKTLETTYSISNEMERFGMQPLKVIEVDATGPIGVMKDFDSTALPSMMISTVTEERKDASAANRHELPSGWQSLPDAFTKEVLESSTGRRTQRKTLLAGRGSAATAISQVHLHCMPYRMGVQQMKKGRMTRQDLSQPRIIVPARSLPRKAQQ